MVIREAFGSVRLEDVAIVGILMFFGIAGSIPGIAPNQASEMTGTAATGVQMAAGIASQAVVNLCIVCLLAAGRRELLRNVGALGCAMALPCWAVLSAAWSQEPLLTMRRAIPFALSTAFGVLLAVRWRDSRILSLLLGALALLSLWSAVLALCFPAIGHDASSGHGGDWQGVFTQKNACGRAMVFAVAAVLAAGRVSLPRVLLFLLFSLELVLSGSRGAWLLGAAVLSLLLLFRASCLLDRSTRSLFLSTVAVTGGLIITVGTAEFAELAAMLGRDPTLTGRTAIWHEVWLAILRHPVLGYGFSAFWRGAQGASWSVVVALRFVLFHAHDGFLEIWLELGVCGLLVFVFTFCRAAYLLWPELRAGNYGRAAWPLAILFLVAAYDFDENTLLAFNGLFFVLYAAVLVRLELLKEERSSQEHLTTVTEGMRSPWLLLDLHRPMPGIVPRTAAPAAASISPQGSKAIFAGHRSPWL